MNLDIDFNLVRSQKLLLIPQLKQALEILGMNSQELFNYIENQLETNPALESTIEDRIYYNNSREDDEDSLDESTPDTITLKEHLLLQLNSLNLDKNQMMIGEYLVDNTDENGYLNADICEVAVFFNTPASKVGKVLEMIQNFDPPGICSRNLKECLLIQLNQMENFDRDAVMVVENFLDDVASDDAKTIAKATGLDIGKVAEIFKLIKELEPRPGREFYSSEKTEAIIADIIVRDCNDRQEIILNEEAFPDVSIAENYRLNGMVYPDNNTEAFLREKANNAVWLMKCLEQRKNIILNIAEKLLKEQSDFFKKGAGYMKRLDTEEFVGSLEMHESVLAEALKGKYLQCRWGIFELKDFFGYDIS